MQVEVDLGATPPGAELADPEDCKAFKVVVRGSDYEAARQAIEKVGWLESADAVWISVDSLRRMAAGRVPAAWSGDFQAMLSYARSKGWLDETGRYVRGHCEWIPAT